MKTTLFLISLVFSVLLFSCSKQETESPSANSLQFKSLTAADTVIKVNDITTITANATGDGLSYKWTASYGTIIGSGSQVQWTVCHQDKFTISCQITDQNNNSDTRQVVIRSHN